MLKLSDNLYLEDYRTFSGADIDVFLINSNSASTASFRAGMRRIGNISTFSYSSYRNKQAVTPIGHTNPKGMTRGPRVIAGTLVFTVFDKSVFLELIGGHFINEDSKDKIYPVLVDQLPPVDIYLFFNNEYGRGAHMMLFGLEFMNEGQVNSIDDLFTENTVNYIAKNFYPMIPVTESFDKYRDTHMEGKIASTLAAEDIANIKKQIKKQRQEFY